jgi:glycosyltransferase involved in cell wall biosynthesis
LPEVAGEAAIYVDPLNASEVADQMQKLANDQELYKQMQERSLERSKLFSWDFTAEGVWKVIKKTIR